MASGKQQPDGGNFGQNMTGEAATPGQLPKLERLPFYRDETWELMCIDYSRAYGIPVETVKREHVTINNSWPVPIAQAQTLTTDVAAQPSVPRR